MAAQLGAQPDLLLTVWQSHSPVVMRATEPWDVRKPPEADAVVTNETGPGGCRPHRGLCTRTLRRHDRRRRCRRPRWMEGRTGGRAGGDADEIERFGGHRRHVRRGARSDDLAGELRGDESFRNGSSTANPAITASFLAGRREGRWQFDLPAYVQFRLEAVGCARSTISVCAPTPTRIASSATAARRIART